MKLIFSPRLDGENNRAYAYRVLRQNIMTCQLVPGEALSEAELAEAFQMSRTPIHEALTSLKEEWLVDILPQRGSSVSFIKIDYVKEGFSMRLMLEVGITEALAGRLTSEQLKAFSDNLALESQAVNKADFSQPSDAFQELDNDFHELLYTFGGFERVWKAMHTATSHYDRVRYLDTAVNQVDQGDILQEHKKIFNYLTIGIPSNANLKADYELHLGRFRTGFQKVREVFPGYFI